MTPYAELVRLLTVYGSWRDENPGRDAVDALQHALQAATRAERAGGTDAEIVMALVHDSARPLSDVRHGEVIAEVMRGRLPEPCYFALRHHGAFQADLLHGTTDTERFAGEPWYRTGQRLAAWDAASFDPGYRPEPLSHFLPRLEAVL